LSLKKVFNDLILSKLVIPSRIPKRILDFISPIFSELNLQNYAVPRQ